MKILLASSEHDSALAHQRELQSKGHIVTICDTGEECFRTYNEHIVNLGNMDSPEIPADSFDVTVLDCEIEDMDALELGKRILSLNPNQRLVLTSSNFREIISRVMREYDTPAQILQKPISGELLEASLEEEDTYLELKRLKTEIDHIRKR
jgi:CheY-like chemotaxis protein